MISETSYLHNKKNGLQIDYFPNGAIKQIEYFLNDRLWETISRADSNGKLLDPVNVHQGTGIRLFTDFYYIDAHCYETYKDGNLDGPYYAVTGLGEAVKGKLTYKPASVPFQPAKKVLCVMPNNDSLSLVFSIPEYRELFEGPNAIECKVISVTNDSVPDNLWGYRGINIGFPDPAVIPRGIWQIINLKNNSARGKVEFDDNGNAIDLIWYDDKGQIFSEKRFAPCPKQKTRRQSSDGIPRCYCNGVLTD